VRAIHNLIVLVLLALVPLAAGAADRRAGFIEIVALEAEDKALRTAIERGGQPLEPAVLMPVFAGDVIRLKSPDSFVRVVLADNTVLEIRGPREIVVDARPEKGVVTSVIDWAWDVVTGGTGEETPTNLVSKGNGPYVAAAPTGGTILRGEDPIYLAWVGGKAPFRVRAGRIIYDTPEPSISFLPPSDSGNRIAVEIKDAAGASTRLTLRLAEAAPQPPEELAILVASKDARATVIAAWLAQQGKGRWRLEAMRRLHALKGYAPADRLLAALAEGR
jgi:hypothetical protein